MREKERDIRIAKKKVAGKENEKDECGYKRKILE